MMNEKQRLLILTGPNMGEKHLYEDGCASYYYGSNGMFCASELSNLPIVDRIFTRMVPVIF